MNYTNTAGDTVIREYKTSASNPNRVAAGSGRTILKIDQPYLEPQRRQCSPSGRAATCTSAWATAAPAGDPGNRAQDTDTLLGKMLRINVNGTTRARSTTGSRRRTRTSAGPGRNEIWQRGLRNPWRFSFDRATGHLWIGDVGQGRYEEIDRHLDARGQGANWGWRGWRATHCYNPSSDCNTAGKVKPILDYSHAERSLRGHRRLRVPRLGDPGAAGLVRVRRLLQRRDLGGVVDGRHARQQGPARATRPYSISSFGENATGELFVVDLGGTIYRIDHG